MNGTDLVHSVRDTELPSDVESGRGKTDHTQVLMDFSIRINRGS